MFYRPLYADRIMAYADTPFVKILTGVRRCGKSTILKMIMEKLQQERDVPADHIVSIRFDSMEYDDMTAKEMYVFLKGQFCPEGRTYLFLDEVQEIRSEKMERREYERLLEIHDNYPKYVLRTDEFAGGNYPGIRSMHVADFLLSRDY